MWHWSSKYESMEDKVFFFFFTCHMTIDRYDIITFTLGLDMKKCYSSSTYVSSEPEKSVRGDSSTNYLFFNLYIFIAHPMGMFPDPETP